MSREITRRMFNAAIGSATMGIATRAWSKGVPLASPQAAGTESHPVKWPSGAYRRLLVDSHVPDWDPHLLANFDAAEYVRLMAEAGFQSVMQYANSFAGLCMWQSKIGPLHANLHGRDLFGDVMKECRRRGLRTEAYYSVVFDNWAFQHHPAWRVIYEDGDDDMMKSLLGAVCTNSPYRDKVHAELRELVGNYDFDGIFIDMTYWPGICYCGYCTERYRKEQNAEPPRIINWDDPAWRQFQKTREQWVLEFAMGVTKTIKDTRLITVNHQYSTIFGDWHNGVRLELRDACDFVGGDFYGGPTQYSLACKVFYSLTPARPFELWTTRLSTTVRHDGETTKTFNELMTSLQVATLHSAAGSTIDVLSPDGTTSPKIYKFLGEQNARRAPYEPFLGGEMLTDVAVYYDRESMYDPAENGHHVAVSKIPGQPEVSKRPTPPHMMGVIGAHRALQEAHIPYGVVTNVTLEKLANFRAVILPNVLEITEEQAAQFRAFVQKGGLLYASGPSSLNRMDANGPRYLLEDVFGVRYRGMIGTEWSYLTPQDDGLEKVIWPQDAFSYPGQMVNAETTGDAQVLATVTLPFDDPAQENCMNGRFAQAGRFPPALTPGTTPGLVVNSFGQGKAIWVAAPVEGGEDPINGKLVAALLKRFLPTPYHFEVDTHPSVEMTLFDQRESHRLLATLLNLDWQSATVKTNATVRVHIPEGRTASAVWALPERKAIPFKRNGEYVEFQLEPFESIAMAAVEYT